MRYIVDIVKEMPDSANYSAWAKAPSDVIRTLKSIGCIPIFIVLSERGGKLPNILKALYYTFSFVKTVKPNDVIFVQRYGYLINFLCKLSKRRGAKVHYIVHDLTFLRFGNNQKGALEKNMISTADVLYVHTENMQDILRNLGYNMEMRIMHLFDYYSDDEMNDYYAQLKMKNIVAFAGNLDKSDFLKQLVRATSFGNVKYHLYGKNCSLNLSNQNSISYMGAFKPNQTGNVKAGWGLLWDGNSIDTCSGPLGKYLTINASHKISLYLTCGMPVIVWKESSLASWLTQMGVCVVIESLKDINVVINNLSDKDYETMVNNARCVGMALRKGEMLKDLIEES